jgi:hypothetical protein
MIIWRFSASRLLSERAEQRAQVLVAAQFFILAPFITYEAVEKLATGGETETSWLGIGLTIATLAICQPLGLVKRRLGVKLGSSATQNLLCRCRPLPCSLGCSRTRCSVSGGSTPWWRWEPRPPPCRRGARHSVVRAVAARRVE